MTKPAYEHTGDEIYRVDAGLHRDDMVACYLVRSNGRIALLDTGTTRTVPTLFGLIADLGLTPEDVDFVIPTHVHLDHAGGAGALMRLCPNAKLAIHPKGATHMIDPSRITAGATAVYGEEAFLRDYGVIEAVPEERVIVAKDGLTLDLQGRELLFIDTPGHANHHCCILDSQSKGFFTGDTFGVSYRDFDTEAGPFIFAPTTPVAFDPEAWQQSLDRLMQYEPKSVFLTHFGRLDHPEDLVQTVRGSIRDLSAIALSEEGTDQQGRQQRIKQKVEEHLFQRARAHGCTLSEETMDRLLGVDIELDAQGLDVWLQRRAKRAAS